MKIKVCKKCKKEKPLSEFYIYKHTNNYYNSCIECIKNAVKKYQEENQEKVKKRNHEYYLENQLKIIQKTQSYNKLYPEVHIFALIKYRCENPTADRYKDYGGRGIKCLITKEEIRKLMVRDGYWDMERPSIDRIDNDGDYTYENCQFIEYVKNTSKSKRKPVLQYDLDGNFIREWESPIVVMQILGFHNSSICACARGKIKQAYNFIWRYKNDK